MNVYKNFFTTALPVKGMTIYGGSKTTPRYLVDILSIEIGFRGVTVNSIIPFPLTIQEYLQKQTAIPN